MYEKYNAGKVHQPYQGLIKTILTFPNYQSLTIFSPQLHTYYDVLFKNLLFFRLEDKRKRGYFLGTRN